MNKLYEHDCDACIYLGNDGKHDFYFHRSDLTNNFTLICRYSSEPADYGFGKDFCMVSVGINKALELAYNQAIFTAPELDKLKQIQCEFLKSQEVSEDDDFKKILEERWKYHIRFLIPE